MRLLHDLARAADVAGWRDRMFAGEHINSTEDRAVYHVALRNVGREPMTVDGKDVMPDVRKVWEQMRAFVTDVREGHWHGATGERIRTVVNIGIGGSDLGPAMAVQALRPFCHPEMTFQFVSNVDGAHLHAALAHADPASTLFIVSSKTFTTQETLANATAARGWLTARLSPSAVPKHFVAVSAAVDKASAFGIAPENVFGFWDWVGGRYSMWSAIGLPIAVALGWDGFERLLAGAHAMDQHFRERAGGAQHPADHGPDRAVEHRLPRARTPTRCCPTRRISRACRPICSSWRWRATARPRGATASR